MEGNSGGAGEVASLVEQLVAEAPIDELVTFILSELKRGGTLIGFEEDCRKAVATSSATGKLQVLQSGAPNELEKKKKRAEVKKELEVALGNFVFLDRRINAIIESPWMRERVEGSVHATAKRMFPDVVGNSPKAGGKKNGDDDDDVMMLDDDDAFDDIAADYWVGVDEVRKQVVEPQLQQRVSAYGYGGAANGSAGYRRPGARDDRDGRDSRDSRDYNSKRPRDYNYK